jgi:hypothetical protein
VHCVLRDNNLPVDVESIHESVCYTCQQGKMHQLHYPKSSRVSQFPLELVFSDVWGPAPESVGRFKYHVSFIDDFNKFTWIYLIKHNSEVFQCFSNFQNLVERLFDKKIIAVQSNWEESIINLMLSSSTLEYHTTSLVLMLTNKMCQSNKNIDTLSKLAYLF